MATTFGITKIQAHSADPDQNLALIGLWDSDFFQSEVFEAVLGADPLLHDVRSRHHATIAT